MNERYLNVRFDYLSFTIPLEEQNNIILSYEEIKGSLAELLFMNLNDYSEVEEWAENGYLYTAKLGENITIRFGGMRNSMRKVIDWQNHIYSSERQVSLMVELKGQACRELEERNQGILDHLRIIEWIKKYGGRFTRIDIAMDDLKGDIISIDTIMQKIAKGMYTSSFRSKPYQIGNIDFEEQNNMTLYFGKNGDNQQLCIYNKSKEQEQKEGLYSRGYWIRFEMRFRHELADNIAYYLYTNQIKDIYGLACGKLKEMLCLKERRINGKQTSNKDVSRYDILESWDKLLNYSDSEKINVRDNKLPTIESIVEWREHSLIKMNFILEVANVYHEEEWLISGMGRIYYERCSQLELLKSGIDFLQSEIDMINSYRKSKVLSEITKADIEEYTNKLERDLQEFEKKFRLKF